MSRSGALSRSSAPGGGCGSRWPRPRPSWGCRSPRRRSTSCGRTVDDIDFDAAAQYEQRAAARRDGPRPRLRRPVPRRPGDHPPGRHQLLRDRQHRPDPDPRVAANWFAQRLVGGDRRAGRSSPRSHRDLPTLGFTHLQPAQPTTVGKRARLWATTWCSTWPKSSTAWRALRARSTKGTTGTQASFLELFDGDHAKVRKLEQLVAAEDGLRRDLRRHRPDLPAEDRRAGARARCPASPQAATRRRTDLRLLAHRKETRGAVREASRSARSAMAYKRNPMRCERICGLARFVMSLQSSHGADTLATQWLERTLDDRANRRLVAAAGVPGRRRGAVLYHNVASGLVVYPKVIARNLRGGAAVHGDREHPDGGGRAPAATARTCTSGSASTARPPPRWSSSRGATTTCWTV